MGSYSGYDAPDTKLVSVRIRMDIFERIEELSEEEARSRSQIVNSLLAKSLGLDRRRGADRMEYLEAAVSKLAREVVRLKKEVSSIKHDECAIDIDDI